MNRNDYRATLRAEQELATYPPSVQNFVRNIVSTVAGTVATVNVTAHPGAVTTTQGGAVPTITVPDERT